MRFISVILLIYITSATSKSPKKFKDESKKLITKPKSPPAIIAIEIVDPNENKTSKNSKRTIDSSLGYGYQAPPKFQVYKYSQHDIPPYRGPPTVFKQGIQSHNYDVQKSISYNVQPGTTLYSSVNNQGQVGGLSSYLPHQGHEPQVPVIILRVFPSQLTDPSAVLHPNLPQTHPMAPVVNSIDVQALLAKYVQSSLVEQQPQYHHQQQYNDGLLTHENYPKDTHTRVIFHKNQPETIAVPEHAYSAVQVETPEMHYAYTSPGGDSSQDYYYDQGSNQGQNYYYPTSPDAGYQQVDQGDYQQDLTPPVQDNNEGHYNYHAHQKRSKKNRLSRIRLDEIRDIIKLDPIKA
ncbi:uncharacterized protein LOC662370 [Tribolium castaneum]|uniref:uncharacterized protein LOC662370 n=1 Tax=Tribolium castaneum TaxID=7070 RepID=UPI0030FE73B4